jgi:uncharacterized membrane protein
LGWFSVALGIAEIVLPRTLAGIIGIRDRRVLLRMLGVRELINGVGILATPMSAGWLWGRVAGDAIDLSLLGAALANGNGTRGRIAAATAAVGGVTAADVLCGIELTRRLGGAPAVRMENGAVRVKRSIAVNRPPEELYKFWRDFENLPRFVANVESVRAVGDKRSRWTARIPGGRTLHWDAEIIRDEPNKSIAWQSLPGAEVKSSGVAAFEPAPDAKGTIVKVEMEFRPPGGSMAAATMFSGMPERQLKENLRRFKRLMETGEIPTIEGQPSGRPGRSEIF